MRFVRSVHRSASLGLAAAALAAGCALPPRETAEPSGNGPAPAPALDASTPDAGGDAAPEPARPQAPLALRVEAGRLVDGTGAPARLHGINYSGLEYACVKNGQIFDGPSSDESIAAMRAWGVRAVRLPLNEQCWLGINGISPAVSGEAYRRAVAEYVARLHAQGLFVVLELHWSAPGTFVATGQQPMPDLDHTPLFWRSVATTFRDDPAVMFDLFNEPYPERTTLSPRDPWLCWRDGCTVSNELGTWDAVGMQALVDEVRATGARQPVMVGGLSYANDLRGFKEHAPSDPANALVAAAHVYNFNRCSSPDCWAEELDPAAIGTPLILSEIGENGCEHAFIDEVMGWADGRGVSYLGWSWNIWGAPGATGCGPTSFALITSWSGDPTPYGSGFRSHLLSLAP